tara:strand:+ start:66 stop:527 length:462 start_codon:yes stop_codon:yes gene_type:complete
MGLRTLSQLKNTNRTFDNILDSMQLNLITNETIAAARTLTNEDSGKTFFINQASAYEITLPLMSTITSGWNATFIISVVDTNAVTIANNTAEDTIVGGIAGADGGAATHAETAVDEIVFISGAVLGDRCTIVSNGTNYFVSGYAADVAHITVS